MKKTIQEKNPNNYIELISEKTEKLIDYFDYINENSTNIDKTLFDTRIKFKKTNFDINYLKEIINYKTSSTNFFLKYRKLIIDFDNMKTEEILKILNELETLNLSTIEFTFRYNKYNKIFNQTINENFKTFKMTILKIQEITEYIKHFNLSPLEQIMFVYDLIKERPFKESEKDKIHQDGVVSKVLFSNDIVCLGYSNLMTVILKELGIEAEVVLLDNKTNKQSDGHAVVTININDPKYNCNNTKLCFDITKNNNCNNEDYWINKYSGFALNSTQIDYLEKEPILNLDISKLKTNLDKDGISNETLTKLIKNTRYIQHSIDDIKYQDILEIPEKNNIFLFDIMYLDEEKEINARLISNLRQLLSFRLTKEINLQREQEIIDTLTETLNEKEKNINLIATKVKKLERKPRKNNITDYTKNPTIPQK